MCLAIPGEIVDTRQGPGNLPVAEVRFGTVTREVCLAYTPEAGVGDWVIVHVGFAIQTLDRAAAEKTLCELEQLETPYQLRTP